MSGLTAVPLSSLLVEDADTVRKPYRLPLTQPPIEGESILGLLIRDTEALGYSNPRSLLLPVGLRRFPLTTVGVKPFRTAEADKFACMLGLDRLTFDRMHHGLDRAECANLLGHTVAAEFVSTSRRKICPLCVKDSPHHRAVWNMTLLTACPKHSCLLLDARPTNARNP